MNKILLLLFTILFSNLAIGQDNNQNKISNTIKNHDQSRIDSIAKKLNYKAGDKIKVNVLFTVNEAGEIVDVSARGPHKAFEEEGIRVVKLIPKFDQSKFNGKPRSVKYALPIIFIVETEKAKKKRLKKEMRKSKKKNKTSKN